MTTDVQRPNLYQVLGVRSDATQKEINEAYQRMIHRFDSSAAHFSYAVQPSLKERIALVQEAYDTLSNPEKRRAHNLSVMESAEQLSPNSVQAVGRRMHASLHEEQETTGKKPKRQNVYQDYYGFSEKPFDLTPDPKYLYLSPKHKEVLAHLVYGLQENNGFIKIIGEVGTGKTTICRSFLRELRTDFSIAYVFNPAIDELELLQTINEELGLAWEMTSRKKLVDTLNVFLLEERKKGHRVVVIIDEAQDLQPSVLEQLRLLSNLETETEKLIQIVLIGQPELDQLLDRDELRQLRQRITISWELLPLNLDETRGYIQHRLNVALGKGKVCFTRSAMEGIYRYSRGIPRMINVIADRTLLIAYTMNTKKITSKLIRPAVKDIGGLKPLSTWSDILWKNIMPALAAVGLLFFGINHFMLPDFNTNVRSGRDINAMIQENPIDLMGRTALKPQFSAVPLPQVTPKNRTTAQEPVASEEPVAVTQVTVANETPPRARRIPSTGPLIISQQEKLVTYLASLSLAESRVEAAKWILKKWNIDPAPYLEKGDAILESLASEQNLHPFELNANLDKLIAFNYPAILEIALPNAQGTKYLALTSVDGDQGVFGSVDRIEMPLEVIDSLWTRKAIILWKDFEHLPENFGPGFKGKQGIWLQKNLRLLGVFKGREAPTYGPKTRRAVIKFQRRNHIKDDGRFDTESRVMLYGLLSIYPTPELA
ncbi:MAG: AAA family ATPase, partial [Nitrospinae bacterium]|nr:AAA family ATPase [Nitrospinota bacterium]